MQLLSIVMVGCCFFFFKQKTAYDVRIRDWSSDVCSADLIGGLAKRTESTVETIRYYEKEGLLPEPSRSDGNYRLYGEEHIERLRFIRHCRTLDMALDEVRTLLRSRDTPTEDCGDVNALLDEHIHEGEEIGRASCRARVCQYV